MVFRCFKVCFFLFFFSFFFEQISSQVFFDWSGKIYRFLSHCELSVFNLIYNYIGLHGSQDEIFINREMVVDFFVLLISNSTHNFIQIFDGKY